MTGYYTNKESLNKTLMFIIKLLNENNFDNWFIAYGTLLGIVRENSCIENDDDIDIMIDNKHYDKLKKLLISKGLEIEYGYNIRNSKDILKTKGNKDLVTMDFYMAKLDNDGNFHDNWEKVTWTNCFNSENTLIEYIWNENKLYLPNNYEKKLYNRYGNDWKTPKQTKGDRRNKNI